MAPPLGLARLLLGCCSLPLLLPAASSVHAIAEAERGVALPGDAEYWVTLDFLFASEGKMEPPFSQDGADFAIALQNSHTTELTLTLGLNLRKYNPMYCPAISVNGVPLVYTPMDNVAVVVRLNQTIGPFDEMFHIRVADPQESGFFNRGNEHTYSVRVLQPPNLQQVVEARGVNVTDASGIVLQSQPPFDPKDNSIEYVYAVSPSNSHINLRLLCSEFATGMKLNGIPMKSGIARLDITGPTLGAMVECQYEDPRWTESMVTRAYALRFIRDTDVRSISINLIAMPDHGKCAQVVTGVQQKGFVCQFHVPFPSVVVMCSDPQLEIRLVEGSGHSEVVLRNGIPAELVLGQERRHFTMRVLGGNSTLELPVTAIRAAPCSSMQCPTGMTQRPDVNSTALAGQLLCQEEACGGPDAGLCCRESARCNTLSLPCPANYKLRSDAARISCRGLSCRQEDLESCCFQDRANCSMVESCGHWKKLRRNAGNIRCSAAACGEADEDTCCEPREVAKCSAFMYPCPINQALRLDAASVNCDQKVCSMNDTARCCARVTEEMLVAAETQQIVSYFQDIGCAPEPSPRCSSHKETCYYDDACEDDPPRRDTIGCWAGGVHERCRFCGFGVYQDCPEGNDCFDGDCGRWSDKKRAWCKKYYKLSCVGPRRVNTTITAPMTTTKAVAAPSCASSGCSLPYSAANPCQCNRNCKSFGDCCADYAESCEPPPMTPMKATATRKPPKASMKATTTRAPSTTNTKATSTTVPPTTMATTTTVQYVWSWDSIATHGDGAGAQPQSWRTAGAAWLDHVESPVAAAAAAEPAPQAMEQVALAMHRVAEEPRPSGRTEAEDPRTNVVMRKFDGASLGPARDSRLARVLAACGAACLVIAILAGVVVLRRRALRNLNGYRLQRSVAELRLLEQTEPSRLVDVERPVDELQ